MTIEIISWSISTKVWDRAVIELATPESAVRLASAARHVSDCTTWPCFYMHRRTTKRLLDSCDFCHVLINFANSLDPDQDRQNVGPDPNPKCLTLWKYSSINFYEKASGRQIKQKKLPSMQSVKNRKLKSFLNQMCTNQFSNFNLLSTTQRPIDLILRWK